ncbi:hypothetical protein Sjap_015319 [Stephania japonica]|uniref:Peroxiredoxin-like 2A n=1 Tax=Stephania japonica TaxID=461633 RepID=A0AAP0IKT1_9MAGN
MTETIKWAREFVGVRFYLYCCNEKGCVVDPPVLWGGPRKELFLSFEAKSLKTESACSVRLKMGSFLMEEFVGNGALKEMVPKLLEEGWDDVPTLKMMKAEDMEALNMTKQQKEALEIRAYLHDRALTQYGDKVESSEKSLPEILALSSAVLGSEFGMRRGHIARFTDRTPACIEMPPSHTLRSKKEWVSSRSRNSRRNIVSDGDGDGDGSLEVESRYAVFKGIVAAQPAEGRVCGCVQPPPIVDSVAPYSAIESISVQKLTPEYKLGMERLVKTKTPPMKASQLWLDKPAVTDFWPRYWGGVVIHDRSMNFFKALGGGKLNKDTFITGFLLNPRAIANYKRAKAIGLEQNFKGEGEIKGGLFIVGSGKTGIAYQFIERNFGDWAPHAEIIEICTRLQTTNYPTKDHTSPIRMAHLPITRLGHTQTAKGDRNESHPIGHVGGHPGAQAEKVSVESEVICQSSNVQAGRTLRTITLCRW